MANTDTRLALDGRDAEQLKAAYNVLLTLQRKTLKFITALGDQAKKRAVQQQAGDSPSRIAFIVTPLMVNHYNHMHRVFRASMYGKLPDLCDQTGGIMCADMSALREELASRTSDANGSLADTFRPATLPDVQFDFKSTRDAVVERAIRMLDSIDIKHPDLTHSIRDDYIQNVRAIQETMTNALEKSRERSAELKTRLDDALKKLRMTEKTLASLPDETVNLRREVFTLKQREIDHLNEITKLRATVDLETLESKRRASEQNLFRDLNSRVNEYSASGNREIDELRKEMSHRIEAEMDRMRKEFSELRATFVDDAMKRVQKEKTETLDLVRSINSNRGDDELENTENTVKRQFDTLRDELAKSERHNASLRQLCDSLERENVELKRRVSISVNSSVGVEQMETQNIQETDNTCNSTYTTRDYEERIEYMRWYTSVLINDIGVFYNFFSGNGEIALQLAEYVFSNGITFQSEYGGHLLTLLQKFTDDGSIQQYMKEKYEAIAAVMIDSVGITEEINKYHEIIQDTSEKIRLVVSAVGELIPSMKTAYEAVAETLEMPPFDTSVDEVTPHTLVPFFERHFGRPLRERVDELIRNPTRSQREEELENLLRGIVIELVPLLKTAYENIAPHLGMPAFDDSVAGKTQNGVIVLFQKHFGRALEEKIKDFREILTTAEQRYLDINGDYRTLFDKYEDLKKKRAETHEETSPVENAESLAVFFETKPTLFRDVLHVVWTKAEGDVLKRTLTEAYYATAADRVGAYERTSDRDLKLYHLIDYTALKKHIDNSLDDRGNAGPEHPGLNEDRFFLNNFINKLGDAQVEDFVKRLDLKRQNKLAYGLFETFYIPIVNKQSFVMSLEGPFANFNMIYRM